MFDINMKEKYTHNIKHLRVQSQYFYALWVLEIFLKAEVLPPTFINLYMEAILTICD